jgi:hypothetical protein
VSAFPDLIGQSEQRTPRMKASLSQTGGVGQAPRTFRYRKLVNPRWMVALGWPFLEASEAEQIVAFVASVGLVGKFDWFDWRAFPWIWVRVGVGDGVTVTFNVPGKETSGHSFFVAGTTSIAGTVTAGAGADGADRVTFDSPPAAAALISAAFLGRRRFAVTFGGQPQHFVPLVEPLSCYSYATELFGVK